MSSINNKYILLFMICFFSLVTDANAAIDNNGIMDEVLNRFQSNASSWANIIESAATRLFWTLVVISMVWNFGMMALRKADIGDFFAEFFRFTVFTGFFWWLLINGPDFARSIINSLRQLGGDAAGLGGYSGQFSPSSIVDIGFIMLGRTLAESSLWSPIDSALGIILGLIVLGLTAIIAVNVLLLYVSAWILAYAGIFFLGFGGAKWTSDMAINYFKTVLSIAAQVMTMILIIGIGVSLINDYYNDMEPELDLTEMAVIAVIVFTIAMLVNRVPQLVSSIITGANIGGTGLGQFGAGAAVGAAAAATTATALAGSMIASGSTQGAGGVSALMAAVSQANSDIANDGFANEISGEDFDGTDEPSGTGNTPFAKAAGYASSSLTSTQDNSSGSNQGNAEHGGDDSAEESGHSQGNRGILGTMGAAAGILASETANTLMDKAKDGISQTPGGRLAEKIKARGVTSVGEGKYSDNGKKDDYEAEIAAFVKRDNAS